MKTPEQLAEEYCEDHDECEFARDAFLAGYQAAKLESIRPKTDIVGDALNSSAARHAIALLAAADKMMNSPEKQDSCEHILDMEKMVDVNSSNNSNGWISVKERLPEFTEGWCIVYGANTGWRWMVQPAYYNAHKEEWMSRFIKHRSEIAIDGKLTEWIEYLPLEDVTHWMPLPKPPEDK